MTISTSHSYEERVRPAVDERFSHDVLYFAPSLWQTQVYNADPIPIILLSAISPLAYQETATAAPRIHRNLRRRHVNLCLDKKPLVSLIPVPKCAWALMTTFRYTNPDHLIITEVFRHFTNPTTLRNQCALSPFPAPTVENQSASMPSPTPQGRDPLTRPPAIRADIRTCPRGSGRRLPQPREGLQRYTQGPKLGIKAYAYPVGKGCIGEKVCVKVEARIRELVYTAGEEQVRTAGED